MAKPKTVKEVEEEVFGTAPLVESSLEKEIVRDEVKTEDGEYNLEVIKDYYGKVDPFYLSKKDPNYEYRFLRSEDKNLSLKTGNLLFQQGGWQICPKPHLVKIGVAERFIAADGTYRVGENILAFMPKKLYEEKFAQKVKQASAPMDAITRKLKKGDNSEVLSGGIHSTMRGIETKEALGMGKDS